MLLLASALASTPTWLQPCGQALNLAQDQLARLEPRFGDPAPGLPTSDRPINAPDAEITINARTVDGVLRREDRVRLRFEYLDDSFLWVVVSTEPPIAAPGLAWSNVSPVLQQTNWSRRTVDRQANLAAARVADPAMLERFLSVMREAADRCLALG